MAVPFIASRVYLKPLLSKELSAADAMTVLKKSKTDLLRRIRAKLKSQTVFSARAKRALSEAISIQVMASSLRVIANHPGFAPLVYGQRKGQMKWLKKARRPIPIITEDGNLIFRSATAKSMKDGKWVHPGRPPTDFVTRAKDESKAFLKEKFRAELHQILRKK